jgi:hypothetical protein
MAFIGLRINYRSTGKIYLRFAGAAIAVEALRQIPTLLLSSDPESFPGVLYLSFCNLQLPGFCFVRSSAKKANSKPATKYFSALY